MSFNSTFLQRVLIAIIFGLGLVILGGFGYLSGRDEITVYADGEVTTLRGSFDSAETALTAANINIGDGDIIVPGRLDSAEAPLSALKVLRAETVQVTINDTTTRYTTHQPTLGAFLTEAQLTVRHNERIIADGQLLEGPAWAETALPETLVIESHNMVSIIDEGVLTQLDTTAKTVGEALSEAGFTIYAADGIDAALGDWISADTTITIKRSTPFTILVDGRQIETRSHHTSSLAVLSEAGIGLVGSDFVRPDPSESLAAGTAIEVVRVTEQFETEDSTIPYESLWQGTDQIEIDQTGVLVAGKPGILRSRTKIIYENGAEVARLPDGEWVAENPTDEVIGYGTKIVLRTLDSADGPIEFWRLTRMRVTSYTAASSGKPADHPAYGITYTGVPAGKGVVAIDPRVVPLRSNLYVPGYGVGYAGDTGGGVKGRWIDLGWDDHNYESWYGYIDVYWMTPVPEIERINFLIPRELPGW